MRLGHVLQTVVFEMIPVLLAGIRPGNPPMGLVYQIYRVVDDLASVYQGIESLHALQDNRQGPRRLARVYA